MSTHYKQLTIDDRIVIQHLLDQHHCQAEIARRLGVHRSTISREIRRNSWQPERDHANLRPYLRNKLDSRDRHQRLYLAGQAQVNADRRKTRSHQPYRMRYDQLVDWVITHLRRGWTPEEISGRLPIDHPDDFRMRVSHETLYAWIYDPAERHRALWQYLPRGHKRRRRKHGRRVHTERIRFRVSIQDRPAEVNDRSEFGHWESDTVIGARSSGGIHTTVERCSRFLQADKLSRVAAAPTLTTQLDLYARLPVQAVRSVTVDNGSEFAHHYRLADTIGVPTYFCDPYSAYQRGTNEHFNGRLRKYLPKGTSFENLSQEELDEIVWEINNRPRKVLGWMTPAEVFDELCSQ